VLGIPTDDLGPAADPFASLAARGLVEVENDVPSLDVRLLALASIIQEPQRSVLVGLAVDNDVILVRYLEGRGARVALQPGPLTIYDVTFLRDDVTLSVVVRDLVNALPDGASLREPIEVVVEWETGCSDPRSRSFPGEVLREDAEQLERWLADPST
jgi:hypothetical protein